MYKTIFHQLWNQRKQNGWIFFELLVVSFFLWMVIDPIAFLTGNKLIPRGYDSDRGYVVRLDAYNETNGTFKPEEAVDSLVGKAFERVILELRHMPELECYSLSTSASFPNSGSWNGGTLYADTTASRNKEAGKQLSIQEYSYICTDESNLFRTYGMRDARTGGEVAVPEDCSGKIFISESIARKFFGTVEAVGRELCLDNTTREVAGVFCDYKHRDYDQPYPLVIQADRNMRVDKYMHWRYVFVFKLKAGVDAKAFEARFHKEVAPKLHQGNFFCSWLKPFETLSEEWAVQSGKINKLRLQYSLAIFALVSIFLGMVGTFWIRCNARRQEIGVMRSMGAARSVITKQFLIEAGILVTTAYIIGLLIVFNYVYLSGMNGGVTFEGNNLNQLYWQNRFGAHFAVVSVVTYLVLLVTALIGTYIPVRRTANILPADALRDE